MLKGMVPSLCFEVFDMVTVFIAFLELEDIRNELVSDFVEAEICLK